MKVEILRSRLYRENHLPVGQILDMDDRTATEFIARGWAKESNEPPPLPPEEVDAMIPKLGKRRNAGR